VSDLILLSPLKGWAAPLSEAPDPVFAEKMMGDGVLVDPVGATLHAPCDGQVISVHHTRHAVTLRATNGAEILIHVGLETVALGGKGFEPHVADGQTVRAGDPLLSFDLDHLARHAKSLITPIILASPEGFQIVRRTGSRAVEVGDVLMVVRATGAATGASAMGEGEASRVVAPHLPHGLHARPAAAVANAAKRFPAEVWIACQGRKANAKSVVALMALGVHEGDTLTVTATGPEAEAAVVAVAAVLETLQERIEPAPPPKPAKPSVAASQDPKLIIGVPASPGLAVGKALRFAPPEIVVSEAGQGAVQESAELARARGVVRDSLEKAALGGDRERRSILAAHIALLDDPELVSTAQGLIDAGKSAAFAWRQAIRAQVVMLQGLDDARMVERIGDLKDLERQVLVALLGQGGEGAPDLPPETILLAEELLPSQLVALDATRLAGLCTAAGGPTSHVAILAAGMGLPAVVAAGERVLAIPDGAPLILDADKGQLHLEPEPWELEAVETALTARRQRKATAKAAALELCDTADGHRVEVFANLGKPSEAAPAVENGAEGSGLLRTEFLFLERDTPPDEEEQLAAYQAIADGLAGRPLIMRTLDIGGDKPAAYLPIPYEDNPALGLRGVRTSLWRPDLLRTQLRAILRVKPAGQCKIMVPMVASLSELQAVRAVLEEVKAELGHAERVELGVMVETPSCAVLADQIAEVADFLSVGTNDLTQYVLAMDRGNPALAAQLDALHPAVLRLIRLTVEGAARHGRWVGVCGGLASDPLAAPVLVGLGVTELSAAPAMIPEVKMAVRAVSLTQAREVALRALELKSAAEVRTLLLKTWPTLSAAGPSSGREGA